jgi:hypothetical protein
MGSTQSQPVTPLELDLEQPDSDSESDDEPFHDFSNAIDWVLHFI